MHPKKGRAIFTKVHREEKSKKSSITAVVNSKKSNTIKTSKARRYTPGRSESERQVICCGMVSSAGRYKSDVAEISGH